MSTDAFPLLTVGTFRYAPTNHGSTARRDGGTTEWWLILDIDPELGRYLRAEYARFRYRTVEARAPLWGTHVSVIRGEEPADKSAWKRHDGKRVEVRYSWDVTAMNDYLWLPVWCPAANAVRVELGLPANPTPPLHLTFGNTKG